VKINAVPIEAYRQTAGVASKQNQAPAREQDGLQRADRKDVISIPVGRESESLAVKAPVSPSLMEGVLSSEEKNELIKHFARFGDVQKQSPIYGAGAQASAAVGTGYQVDVKA
jgi:hypothetical protein